MGGTLASRFAAARHKRGWSQTELAQRIGVSQRTISLIECGRSRHSRYLGEIAHVLDVSEAWLVFGTHVLTPPLTEEGIVVAAAFERMTASDRDAFRGVFQACGHTLARAYS